METLLGDPDLALPPANYTDGTGRFKPTLGEQPHTESSHETEAGSQRVEMRDKQPCENITILATSARI